MPRKLLSKWECRESKGQLPRWKIAKQRNVEIGMRTLVNGVRIPFAGVFQCVRLAEHVSLI